MMSALGDIELLGSDGFHDSDLKVDVAAAFVVADDSESVELFIV
jgi:hypothetical protein